MWFLSAVSPGWGVAIRLAGDQLRREDAERQTLPKFGRFGFGHIVDQVEDRQMDDESVRVLWRELDQVRQERALTYGQLHAKIGGKEQISVKTLTDRLRNGRKTSWEDIRLVAVRGLGQDEAQWKAKFDQAAKQDRERVAEQRSPAAQGDVPAPLWNQRRVGIAVLAGVGALGLLAVFVWPGGSSRVASEQDVGCARVSDGTVRVYQVPGEQRSSFLKYQDERIRFPVPPNEVTSSDGLRYRQVLTPSRYDGYGWILSETSNLTDQC
jgi:hypothetical protein